VVSLVLWTVAPLAALHLWLWLRHRRVLAFQLLLDVVLAVVVGPALLVGGDLNPVRCLERNRPFSEVEWDAATQMQPTQSDLVLQFHPWWDAAGEQLRAGRLPLIADRIGGGLPLLANGQTGLWAPVMLPVWLHGPERGTTVMALWKIEAAGLGAFLLLFRAFRLRWVAAAVGGLATAGSAYQIGWLLVPLGWVTAALPWVWWLLIATVRRRARWWVPLAAGGACGWLLGCGLHPETAVVAVGSATLAALVLHPRRWSRVVAALVVAAVVAGVLSWPTLAYIASSARLEVARADQPNRQPVPAGWRGLAARQAVLPSVNGHPARGDWRAPFSYAPAATGVGGMALGLIAAGTVRRRHRRLLLAAGLALLAAGILYLRLPPLDWPLVRLPPLDRMTLPRFAVLLPWGLAVWASLATDGLLSHRPRRPWWWPAGMVGLLATVAIASRPFELAGASAALLVATIIAAAAAPLVIGRPRLVPTVMAVELALYAVAVNPAAVVEDRLPRPPLVDELRRLQAAEGGRVIGIGGVLPPNLAGRYGLADLRAYDPVRPAPYARFLARLGQPDRVLGGPLARAPAGLCGAWSVRFLVAPPGAEPRGWKPLYADDSGSLWRNPRWLEPVRVVGRTVSESTISSFDGIDFSTTAIVPPGSPVVAAEAVELDLISFAGPRREAAVRCDGPCLLVAATPWAPGWRVHVDGRQKALLRADLAALGVVVPAGEHRVVLTYNPWRPAGHR
jgi:hypothetical protein